MKSHSAFDEVPTDAKNAQIAAVVAVNFARLAGSQHVFTDADEPDVDDTHGKGKAGKAQEGMKSRSLKIKPMSFHVSEHLFDPHAPAVEFARCLRTGKIGCQEPGFLFAPFPVGHQIRRIGAGLGQDDVAHPDQVAQLGKMVQAKPVAHATWHTEVVTGLTQRIVPTPDIQLFNQQCITKLTISHQRHLHAFRNQVLDVTQQLNFSRSQIRVKRV